MTLTKEALKKLTEQKLRLKLAMALGFSEQWIVRVISKNKENGPLTTITAINLIKLETGLTEDQILKGAKAEATK